MCPQMITTIEKRELAEIIESISDAGGIDAKNVKRIINESTREAVAMVFGEEIADVVMQPLGLPLTTDGEFDPGAFLEELKRMFKDDTTHIQTMIMCKILTKYHQRELLKKISLPFTFD